MYAIKLKAHVPADRKLIINLPADAPTGDVELTIQAQPAAEQPATLEGNIVNPERERLRAKLLAAGALVTSIRAPEGYQPLTPEERMRIGKLPPGARPSEELINEDRGEW